MKTKKAIHKILKKIIFIFFFYYNKYFWRCDKSSKNGNSKKIRLHTENFKLLIKTNFNAQSNGVSSNRYFEILLIRFLVIFILTPQKLQICLAVCPPLYKTLVVTLDCFLIDYNYLHIYRNDRMPFSNQIFIQTIN